MTNDRPLPEFFQNNSLQLIIFGGKGGVGKTTMAATAAVHLARSYHNDKKVLVISTDPAHSLSDSFDLPIGDTVTPIQWSVISGQPPARPPARMSRRLGERGLRPEGWAVSNDQNPMTNDPARLASESVAGRQCPMTNLFALELDAARLLDEFKQKNDAVIKKLADRGTYFDTEDITEFFDLSLPGMDEVMSIIEIANLLKEGTYDVLILDTAPTGHTVRMLNLPEQMRKWIEVMDLMQHKHRYMATHFTGKKYVKDECDIFLDNLSSDIDRVKKLLSNKEKTRFVPVTIPEPMSIYETERLISSLERQDIAVREIIVNRVMDSDGCSFCSAKMADQKEPIAEIERVFSKYDLIKVPVFPKEIRGGEALTALAEYLTGRPGPPTAREKVQADEKPQAYLNLGPALEFILFVGKGGVGKTSLASAVALHLAQQNPERKVLVFSTDPAHSLSDSFRLSIGDKITPIEYSPKSKVQSPKSKKGQHIGHRTPDIEPWTLDLGPWTLDKTNLFALEINADELWEDFKAEFKDDIEEVFNSFLGKGVDIKFDREVMTELLTLAPPGLDEIMALDRIMELREQGEFDIFVLDTSPTGHLLRFLELPDMVREWLKAFFRLLLKYKGVVRLTRAAERALALSKNVRRIQETLVDPQRTAFVAVTIPEAMGLLELERLTGALENAKIPCEHIAINMVVPETDCAFCSSKRAEQQGYIKKIRSKFPSHTITGVPLFANEVRGITDLDKIGGIIFGSDRQV